MSMFLPSIHQHCGDGVVMEQWKAEAMSAERTTVSSMTGRTVPISSATTPAAAQIFALRRGACQVGQDIDNLCGGNLLVRHADR